MEWSVEGYKEMLHERFSHYTSVVVKGFCDIQQSSFSEEVKMLMLEAFIGEPTIDVQLFFMEDLFDEADVEFRVPLTLAPRYIRDDERFLGQRNADPLLMLIDPGHTFELNLLVAGWPEISCPSHQVQVRDAAGLVE